jgi:hypothetical protein
MSGGKRDRNRSNRNRVDQVPLALFGQQQSAPDNKSKGTPKRTPEERKPSQSSFKISDWQRIALGRFSS